MSWRRGPCSGGQDPFLPKVAGMHLGINQLPHPVTVKEHQRVPGALGMLFQQGHSHRHGKLPCQCSKGTDKGTVQPQRRPVQPVPAAPHLRKQGYIRPQRPSEVSPGAICKKAIFSRFMGASRTLLPNSIPRRVPKVTNRPEKGRCVFQAVWEAMPAQDAQGVMFIQNTTMTPLVYVAATGTRVWESSCGSGTVALAWYLARKLADGKHGFAVDEPGGRLEARVTMRMGRAVRIVMGGSVLLGEEREIEL